jgi:hypothetical protein
MPRLLAAIIAFASFSFVAASASAQECYPYCDYVHDYGPYDYTYIRPQLFAYPVCSRLGNCTPHEVYSYAEYPVGRILGQSWIGPVPARGVITVRPLPRRR